MNNLSRHSASDADQIGRDVGPGEGVAEDERAEWMLAKRIDPARVIELAELDQDRESDGQNRDKPDGSGSEDKAEAEEHEQGPEGIAGVLGQEGRQRQPVGTREQAKPDHKESEESVDETISG